MTVPWPNSDADDDAWTEQAFAYMRHLRDLEEEGAETAILLGPFAALMIATFVEMALRHPATDDATLARGNALIDRFSPYNGKAMPSPTSAVIMDLMAAEQAGDRHEVRIGPFTAMLLIGWMQLATRHPDMAEQHLRVGRDMIDRLRPMFAGTFGEQIIDRGMTPEWDYD